jgi:asparagine synthetase B (glutamine-hydrolysing)
VFLVAISQNPVRKNFKNNKYKIDYFKIGTLFVIIITDNFLSKYFTGADGFSIIESPPNGRSDKEDLILSGVIYNKIERILSIFTDSRASKSIYYYINSIGEFYCSTHILMLKKAGVLLRENISVLPEFFAFQRIASPNTIYRDIKRIAFGTKLYIRVKKEKCIIEKIIKYNPFVIKSENYEESYQIDKIIKQVNYNILQSIRHLKPYSKRLAVLLSGGIDSSILFTMCRNTFGINDSYSTSSSFIDSCDDVEKNYAITAAEAMRSENFFYRSDGKRYLHELIDLILIAEEPTIRPQCVMLNALFKNGIPKNKDIVVNGTGADIAFGLEKQEEIYNIIKYRTINKLLSLMPVLSMLEGTAKFTKKGYGFISRLKIFKDFYIPIEDPDNKIYSSIINMDWICKYFNVSKEDIISSRYEIFKAFSENPIYDRYSILSLIINEMNSNSNWSKIAENNSKIIYYPFLDSELLNNAFSIKWEIKLKEHKSILQAVARDLGVPEFIIKRKKSGFVSKIDKWGVKGGILDPLANFALRYFDKNVINNFQTQPWPYWILLVYTIWKRLLIDNEPLDLLHGELDDLLEKNSR